jgi:large subunit ribosomal protein L22
MKAYGKNIRISPKKLRVVASIVRWMNVKEALDFLKFAPKKWAWILFKLLKSASANAQNNDGQKIETLYIDTISVNKGIVYKRWNPVSRWRMHPILKRTSNIILELQVK